MAAKLNKKLANIYDVYTLLYSAYTLMYSARCRRPWGTAWTDPRWRPRFNQAEERERGIEDRGRSVGSKIDPVSAMSGAAWGARLILSQLWIGQEVGGGRAMCALQLLISPPPLLSLLPPPQQSHRNDQRLNPPGWKEGRGRSERWGGVRKSPGPQQLASC